MSTLKIILIAVGLVGISYGLRLMLDPKEIPLTVAHLPDHYMENFTTLTTDEQGLPKNRLSANSMRHYPTTNITDLDKPKLELFRHDKPTVIINADKGKRQAADQRIQLNDNVYIYQVDEQGTPEFELMTKNVQFLPDQEYAETDEAGTFIRKRLTINATGIRAYLQEQKVEFLHNVHTTIKP